MVKDKDGKILYELPAFQEIFPEDWDVPMKKVNAMKAETSNDFEVKSPIGPA